MGIPFFSEEWIVAYKAAINGNPAYKTAAADWTYGVVALVCKAQPSAFPQDVGIWLDLDRGVCRDAKLVKVEEAAKAPFCITGEYARWKQVLRKELEPVKGMMQGKLKLKGDLPTIVRAVAAAQELVNSAAMLDTKFLDE
ncbi:MAG: SCP2 sterol-binding domain-containing protein [Spirochaetia bacterium]|jgi:putative sterol carrier protein